MLPSREQRLNRSREVVRFGGSFELAANDVVREVFMVGGQVKIAGEVTSDIVVLFGTLELTDTAVIAGDVVIINSDAVIADSARVRRDLVSVMGHVAASATFQPGGSHVLIDPRVLGPWVDPVIEWFTRGLIWGRLIVPDMSWVWAVAAVFALLTVLLALLAPGPVRSTATVLSERPLSSMLVGLAALILVGPISVLLAVSILGIVVIPFVLLGFVLAGILGRVAVVQWLGAALFRQSETDDRLQTLRSLAIGIGVLTLLYMVPVLGLITWASVGVFGLGAAALAFIAGYRRENPAPVRPPRTPTPPSGGGGAPASAPLAESMPSLSFESADLSPPAAPAGGSMAMADPMAIPAGSPSASQVASVDMTLFPRATFVERIAAAVLDVILVLFLWNFVDRSDSGLTGFLAFLLAYHVGFVTWKGTTLGGIICQLRVVRLDGHPVRFVDALVRGLSSLFSALVVGLGFFAIIRDADRQAWHDKVGGTLVVKVPKNWPI